MIALRLFLLLTISSLPASEISRTQYFELIQQYPNLVLPQGNTAKGEIEIILDNDKMALIEQTTGREVGVIFQDKYWFWINDACLFPSGKEGVYGRIVWNSSLDNFGGVAVMPIVENGKVALNCNFRHATRSWEIELPRGGVEKGENVEKAAKREVAEETGMVVQNLIKLGEMTPDTGLTNTIVPIYAAKVIKKQETQLEDFEAIEEILTLSIPEIKKAFAKGYHLCTIREEKVRVNFRDPFLAYALVLYEAKIGTAL